MACLRCPASIFPFAERDVAIVAAALDRAVSSTDGGDIARAGSLPQRVRRRDQSGGPGLEADRLRPDLGFRVTFEAAGFSPARKHSADPPDEAFRLLFWLSSGREPRRDSLGVGPDHPRGGSDPWYVRLRRLE